MNQYQVTELTKRLAKELFNMEWDLPININGRLTRALGQMRFKRSWSTGNVYPTNMELATRLLANYSSETIESVIKHELCHWALCLQGRPYDDGHPVFEAELRRVGAHSTGVIQVAGTVHQATCKACGKVAAKHNSQGKLWKYIKPGSRYTTKCCRAGLQYGGVVEIEDTNSANAPKTQVPQTKPAPQIAAANAQPVAQPAVRTAATVATPTSLDAVLEKGPRGVTNKQMIPAIQKVLDMNDKFLLEALEKAYPSVFQATIRYIGKSYQAKLEMMRS